MRAEELESRAQPALFGVAVSVPALAGLDHAPSAQAALHANEHASFFADFSQHAQIEIVLQVHFGNSPDAPGAGSGGQASDPQAGSPAAPVALPAAGESTSFVLLGREVASQLRSATAATGTPLTPASLLLPPGASADAPAATSAPAAALAPDAPAAMPVGQGGVAPFPGAGSIPYITTAVPLTSDALFGAADGPVAAGAPVNARAGAVAVTAAQRLDLALDLAEDVVALAPPQQPAANADVLAAVMVEVAADAPAPAPAETGTSPWVWAATALGAAAGASWAVRRYWLKPAPAQTPTDARSWRRYLLGLDFYRM